MTGYVASSNVIAIAVGYSVGMPKRRERVSGRTAPTARPYFHPQISPHSRTGMCIGSSIRPTAGICPVKKGSTSPMATKRAPRIICLICVCFMVDPVLSGVLSCDRAAKA